MALVFAVLLTFAVSFRVPLDAVADPSDATYVPRPEWYFLSLFQLLKYFPGKLEPVATVVIPGLVVGGLLALPFLDRRPDRHPLKRPLVVAAFALVGAGVVSLTYLGFKDSPAHADPSHWGTLAIAGREFAQDQRCETCHRIGGAANPMADMRLKRDAEWLRAHVADPEIIAPGTRKPPPGGMSQSQGRAVASYMHKVRAGGVAPDSRRRDADGHPRLRPLVRQLPHHRRRRRETGPRPDARRREARREVAARMDQRSRSGRRARRHAGVQRQADAGGADGDCELPGGAEVGVAGRGSRVRGFAGSRVRFRAAG